MPNSKTNQKGQGMVEYLIIVALIAVSSIAIVKVLGQNVKAQFGRVTNAIQGSDAKPRLNKVQAIHIKQNDLSNFMDGAIVEKD